MESSESPWTFVSSLAYFQSIRALDSLNIMIYSIFHVFVFIFDSIENIILHKPNYFVSCWFEANKLQLARNWFYPQNIKILFSWITSNKNRKSNNSNNKTKIAWEFLKKKYSMCHGCFPIKYLYICMIIIMQNL